MKKKTISTKQLLAKLNSEVKRLGGPTKAAKEWGTIPQSVSNAMSAIKLPNEAILKALYLKPIKTINYRYEEAK